MANNHSTAPGQNWPHQTSDAPVPIRQEPAEDDEGDASNLVTTDRQLSTASNELDSPTRTRDDDNNSSDLSSLGTTPSPPTTPRLAPLPRPLPTQVECTHTTWCDCPMHAGYDAGIRIPHLSEYALSQMKLPDSNVRAESYLMEDTDQHLRRTKEWSDWVATALPIIGMGDLDKLRPIAQTLVQRISNHFKPSALGYGLAKPIPVIEKIGHAMSAWKKDLDYDKLEQTVRVLLQQRTDLIFFFQSFLPKRLRKVTLEQVEDARKRGDSVFQPYWIGIEELVAARLEFGGWEKEP